MRSLLSRAVNGLAADDVTTQVSWVSVAMLSKKLARNILVSVPFRVDTLGHEHNGKYFADASFDLISTNSVFKFLFKFHNIYFSLNTTYDK